MPLSSMKCISCDPQLTGYITSPKKAAFVGSQIRKCSCETEFSLALAPFNEARLTQESYLAHINDTQNIEYTEFNGSGLRIVYFRQKTTVYRLWDTYVFDGLVTAVKFEKLPDETRNQFKIIKEPKSLHTTDQLRKDLKQFLARSRKRYNHEDIHKAMLGVLLEEQLGQEEIWKLCKAATFGGR